MEVLVSLSMTNTAFDGRDINFKSNNAIDCPLSAETKATNMTCLKVKSFSNKLSLHGNDLIYFRTTETYQTVHYFGVVGFKLYTPFKN